MNCWSNYKISKRASQKLLEVKEHYIADMSVVGDQPSPEPVQKIPIPCDHVMDNDNNLREALDYIKNDPVGIIGIWGVGGVGKTHLLNKINNSFLGDSSFHSIIYVIASKECSVQKIQAEIVKKLNLRKDDDVKFQAHIISEFLDGKNFLLLLDDLWERIDLLEVGIPTLGIENNLKRKVVLTTRSQDVCGQMEVRKQIKVACLRDEEAWKLFLEKVDEETLPSSSLIELAKQVVKELKGLPLALVTVGRAMYAKRDPVLWEHTIDYMKGACRDKDGPLSMETVFRQLKFSYDSLRNDTLKRCFLTCALWPEDVFIATDELDQCWMGLGLVDKDDIQSSYREACNVRSELQSACLLESWHTSRVITMHDVVRDMALWICCGCSEKNDNWVVHAQVGKNLSRRTIPWSKAECVSLMWNRIEELPPMDSNYFPAKLRTLCLQGNRLDGRIVETLKNFTALTYLDLCSNSLTNIPGEICALANLEYLDLGYNSGICEVPTCFRELSKLKFLYLSCTNVWRIPEDVISSLKALQVIDLTPKPKPWNRYGNRENHADHMPSVVLIQELTKLSKLKAVGITVESVSSYEALKEYPNLPIRRLVLNIEERESVFYLLTGPLSDHLAQMTLHKLEIYRSSMEEIIIERHESGGHLEQNYSFDALNQLDLQFLENLKVITWKGIRPELLFHRLTVLYTIDCDQLEDISWALHLPFLEELWVQGCGKMRHAIRNISKQESSMQSIDTFPRLVSMLFANNDGLVSICDSDVTFPSLKSLRVTNCENLKRLPFRRQQSLPPKLQVIYSDSVEWWDNLEWEEEGIRPMLEPLLKIVS